jgi:hypothetical protein
MVFLWESLIIDLHEEPVSRMLNCIVLGIPNFVFDEFSAGKSLKRCKMVSLENTIDFIPKGFFLWRLLFFFV